MKKTIRKIEILFMALICIFAMSGMPMQVYAGPADNSLETLTVAEGSLSPAFEGSRMYYTVQVAQDVSSVTVSAKTVNPAATIQSGVGTTTLKTDGDTKIDVVVQAENGNLATYHLTITKSATGAASTIISILDGCFFPLLTCTVLSRIIVTSLCLFSYLFLRFSATFLVFFSGFAL